MLSLAAGGAALAATGPARQAAAQTRTTARIVVIGAGAGGTALANRLVPRLDGAQITLLDPRVEHLYQPGLSLVAAGLKPADYVLSKTTDWLPDGVTLIAQAAAAIDAEAKTVATASGEVLPYDFLVLAPGLVLDHDAIEGFSLDMVGQNGIGALYAGPQYAAATWQAAQEFTQEGGAGLFTRPETEMKCAGAPLKHTFLIDDIARTAGTRGKAEFVYAAAKGPLMASPYSKAFDLCQCAEDPGQFILRIEWTSAEDHMEKFRGSAEFRAFFAQIKPFVRNILEMRHYKRINQG